MSPPAEPNYELAAAEGVAEIPAPELPYQPPAPKQYRPRIGLIGCGGISASHLDAYLTAGWEVVALCNRTLAKAEQRRREFFPAAAVCADYRELLERPDLDVLDITLHPVERAPVIAAALRAHKHVLSQKPLANDLATARELAALAAARKVKLAVNQNGRWAPYLSYARLAVAAGLLGEIQTVQLRLNWDHTWCAGTPFETVRHLVLYDFGLHWFDWVAQVFAGRKARRVFASAAAARGQTMPPPLLAQATIEFDAGLASLVFDGHSRHGAEESILITGTHGTLRTRGKLVDNDQVELHTRQGVSHPRLAGRWFNDGFRGAMGELLCAIEEDREPAHSATNNLRTLSLALAACRSADTGRSQIPERSD